MIAEVNGLFKNKIVKNASWIIACKIFQMILNLIVGMLTARYLGPSNYGVVNYAASVVAFMIPVVNLGLTNVMVQELVNNPDKEGEILGTSMSFSFASAVLSVLGVICFACIANRGEKETILVCAFYSLSLLFRAFEMVIYWFQSKLMSKYTSIIMLVAYFVVALYRIFLLANHMSIYWFALSQTIDVMLISVISIIVYKIKGGEKFGFSLELGKRLLKKSHYYIVSGLMVTIFAQTDKIMLKVLISSEDTGYYSAAVTCAGMSSFVFSAIIDSMRPSIFARKKESEEKFEERLISLYTIIIYISLLQCVVMTLLSRFIILFLYGKDYTPAIDVLRIVVWYTTFAYLGSVRNIWILAENRQKYLWRINCLGALSNVILNFLLIPLWGMKGAAAASLFTQIFTNVIVGYIIRPISHNNTLMIKALNPHYLLNMRKNL